MGILLGFVIAVVATLAWISLTGKPGVRQKATAQIVAFTPAPSRFQPNTIIVTARTREGETASDTASTDDLLDRGCRVGDEVDGELVGVTLEFNASTCRRSTADRPTQTPR
jgi:hypothetical protein